MHTIFSIFAVLCLSSAADLQHVPVLPSHDPFYNPPQSFKHAAPGQVLRVRTAPGDLLSTFGNASEVYNILFRSTDSNYRPTWGYTTVFVPRAPKSSALLSYQIPYNTPDADAGPTTLLYGSETDLGLIGTDINHALSRGWYVNVPDHEGPHASFLCGVQEGHATLDSVRAVLSYFQGHGLEESSNIALWGYSGGGIASEFAAELQAQYAPEMSIAGVAIGGVVSNISAALPNVVNSPFAGLIPAGLVGFSTQHADVRKYLHSQLKTSGPYNATDFLAVKNQSIVQAFATFDDQPMFEYFRHGKAFFDAPVLQNAFARDGIMGHHGIPRMPLFMYKAIHDEITSIADTDEMVARYCTAKANIEYERNSIGGHVAEETNGDERALRWLSKILEGDHHHTGCNIRTVARNTTDSSL